MTCLPFVLVSLVIGAAIGALVYRNNAKQANAALKTTIADLASVRQKAAAAGVKL